MAETANYQAVLADLMARYTRLGQLIAGIRAEMGQPDSSLGPELEAGAVVPMGPVDVTLHADTFFGLSIVEAAKKYLRMARRAQHVTAIAAALEQGGLKKPTDNVLYGVLVRAAKGRDVIKVGKGMWGLSEWYPRAAKEPAVVKERRGARRAKAKTSGRSRRAGRVARPADSRPAPAAAAQPGARLADVATEIIRGAGKPIHATEITKLVNERGVKMARLPIEGYLNKQVRAGKLRKTAPSTFAVAS